MDIPVDVRRLDTGFMAGFDPGGGHVYRRLPIAGDRWMTMVACGGQKIYNLQFVRRGGPIDQRRDLQVAPLHDLYIRRR